MQKNNNSPLKFGMVANMNNIMGAIRSNPTLAAEAGLDQGVGTVNTNILPSVPNPYAAQPSPQVAPPSPQVAPPGGTGNNMFEGQKFQITPVQMKGSFSPACQTTASKIYGSEEEREASVSPLNKVKCGSYKK